ncbi:MAG: alpha/beta fold hydrolase [Paracoccaceae bacterium]|nr:MAG: alpha/beta fold hydrolase [Paracoccaceae bacterium]
MPEATNATGPADPADRAALIHAIYRIALEPRSYDVFMDHWDRNLTQALDDLTALHDGTSLTDPEIDTHFETAFNILQELGRPESSPPMDGEGPRMLVDAAGVVVWLNRAAAAGLGLETRAQIAGLDSHAHPPGAISRLLRDLSALAEGDTEAQRILRLDLPDRTLFQIARPVTDRDGQRLILFAPLMTAPPPEVERMLQATFGLTEAETAVATALANGQRPEEIAARRGVSVLTVRSQVKVLLSKTGVTGQLDLVRLLLALGHVLNRAEATPRVAAEPLMLATPSGRAMPVVFHGPPGGRPVLFLHGMLDGCTPTPAIEAALVRHRIRLIAPFRPGFGTAPADEGPVETAPHRLARDVEAALDQLGLRRVAILGHMAGSVYAFAVAARLQDRVAGIVSVAGGVPILSVRQFATMSRRQRLVAYTALYAPGALPFVLRAGIRQLDYNGAKNFVSALYENSAPDMAKVTDPDVFHALKLGYEFAVSQGHSAFEIDSHHVVRDWTALVEGSRVPVALVHGRHDPVVSAASVEEFASRLGPRAVLDLLPDCGQLVLYHAPDAVFAAVARLFDSANGSDRPDPAPPLSGRRTRSPARSSG